MGRASRFGSRISGIGAFLSPRSLTMTDSEFESERNSVFDSAKRASDFVGIIVRLAFLQFASFYFLKEAPETEGIMGYALGLSAVSCFGLTIWMARAIFRIVFLWEIKDTRRAPPGIVRAIMVLFALVTTVAIYFAVMHLVSAIASNNALVAAT
jgi:hypothetical protein